MSPQTGNLNLEIEFRWSVNLDENTNYISSFTNFPGRSAFPSVPNIDN